MEHSTKEGPSYMLPEITKLQGTLAVRSTKSALETKERQREGQKEAAQEKKKCNREEGNNTKISRHNRMCSTRGY